MARREREGLMVVRAQVTFGICVMIGEIFLQFHKTDYENAFSTLHYPTLVTLSSFQALHNRLGQRFRGRRILSSVQVSIHNNMRLHITSVFDRT